jgi:enoyl-CoA hydratase/carnithine racemase
MDHRVLETGSPHLLAEVREGVAILTLNRPDARNALGDTVSPMLRTMLARCDADPEVGAFLITGAGKAFCAGGDIKSMGQPRSGAGVPRDEAVAELARRQRALTGALVASRKPSIAALPGPAAGAGLSLALACDLRIAARGAFVRTAYIRIGLPGDYGISWLLTRAVGPSRARELMLLSEDVDAERCERIGLVNQVTEEGELFDRAFAMAASLAARPRGALGLMKDNLDDALTLGFPKSMDREAARMVDHIKSDEARDAIRAMNQRGTDRR